MKTVLPLADMKLLGVVMIASVMWMTAGVWAGEVVPRLVIDNVTYTDIRWGPVNDGKIMFFHNRGVKTGVPLAKLPAEYQRKFGYDPNAPVAPAPRPAAKPAVAPLPKPRSAAIRAAPAGLPRPSKVILNGALVNTSELAELTGFFQSYAVAEGDGIQTRGMIFELARLRDSQKKVPAQLLARPGLWHRTGEQVFLYDYRIDEDLGMILTVYGREVGPVKNMRAFRVGSVPKLGAERQR